MKNWLLGLALCAGMIGVPALSTAQGFDEGIEYQLVTPPQPTSTQGKVEVLELFWYGCPHCYQLEPYLEKWRKTKPEAAEFVRMPAILGPSWEPLARAYYSAELLGVLDKVHGALFDRIHKEHDRKLNSEDRLADFFAEFGVDKDKFHSTYNSFAVATKVSQARMMTRRYGINGVPSIIVAGKYRTSASIAGGNEGMLKLVNELVAREAATMGDPVAEAKP